MANIGLTQAILEAVKRPEGLRANELKGFHPQKVANRAGYMADSIKSIHRATISHKEVRFFDTAPRAEAYALAVKQIKSSRTPAQKEAKPRGPSLRQIGHAQSLEALRRAEEREADLRASNRSGYELTEEDKAKVVDAGGFSGRHRYAVDPAEITGGFGALKPGQYAFEATSCAARAFA
jgi:hypothetical protein